jgi:hypothetical protein
MKLLPKILKFFFIIILLMELFGANFILSTGHKVRAADATFTPQVGIPNSPFSQGKIYTFNTNSTKPIAEYIQSIYKYAIGIVGILATVVMMVGGVMWIMSGGNTTAASEAKAWISASLTGLVLTLCSYLILATVNPALTNFKITDVKQIKEIGCCYAYTDAAQTKVECNPVAESTDCPGKTYSPQSCYKIPFCANNGSNTNVSIIGCQVASDPCKMPDGSIGYCRYTKSEVCYKLKAAGELCGDNTLDGGIGKGYECASNNCVFGLASCTGYWCCN